MAMLRASSDDEDTVAFVRWIPGPQQPTNRFWQRDPRPGDERRALEPRGGSGVQEERMRRQGARASQSGKGGAGMRKDKMQSSVMATMTVMPVFSDSFAHGVAVARAHAPVHEFIWRSDACVRAMLRCV